MATTPKTDEVLASARKDLQAQLDVVRGEISRLAAEDHALTVALSSLDGNGASARARVRGSGESEAVPAAKASTRPSARGRKATTRRGRRRATGKSTADRIEELRGLLADGPKSRSELAGALGVSPARVQQLLAALGSAVSSRPHPEQRQGKLWALAGQGNGASAAKPAKKPSSGKRKRTSSRKAGAGSKQAGK
jgi:plasmid maintenance system antidote protein VapI